MIFYNKQEINSIDLIYNKFNKNEFKSPRRSTIPLIVLFKHNQILSKELINLNSITDIDYIFEYKISAVKGKGLPSCTDLMIEYSNDCIAIEAKRTEPPYEKVKKWLSNSSNKRLVVEGWLEIINNYTGLKIEISEIQDLPYQLIHRVASACSLMKLHTKIIYIGFDLNKRKSNYYLNCLECFSSILENKLDLYLYCYNIDKTEEQIQLERRWDLGERDLSKNIISGLQNDNLMKLSETMKRKINKSA
ncbi:MAG: hypothetical protein K8F54_11730 [Altibacter sp.]|uniref:DUF6946 family protein n=1 Tax=Altibacter sp. TaxID=2024823 RepID=UPI001DE7B1AF|nr:hypothetical protein [Altibacter sp.]MBZ0328269.1 hypothetical protein [Altibacter sp.]